MFGPLLQGVTHQIAILRLSNTTLAKVDHTIVSTILNFLVPIYCYITRVVGGGVVDFMKGVMR